MMHKTARSSSSAHAADGTDWNTRGISRQQRSTFVLYYYSITFLKCNRELVIVLCIVYILQCKNAKTNRLFNSATVAKWKPEENRVGAVSLFPFNSWVSRCFFTSTKLCTVPFYLMNWYYGEFSKLVIYVIKARNTLRYYSARRNGRRKDNSHLESNYCFCSSAQQLISL